jgi:hypothetical protein
MVTDQNALTGGSWPGERDALLGYGERICAKRD